MINIHNMRRVIVVMLFCLFTTATAKGQSFGLNWLFKPGMRISGGYLPDTRAGDSVRFGMSHLNVSLIIPAGGKVEASLKELNLKMRQTFVTVNSGVRLPRLSLSTEQRTIYNFSAGVTRVVAGIRQGIWIYSANAGIVEDVDKMNRIHPFFIGAILHLRVRGLRTHHVYGLAAAYRNGRFIPVPVLGIHRKLADKWDVSLLLPVQAEVSYKTSPKHCFYARTDFSTFRSGLGGLGTVFDNDNTYIQYRQLQTSISYRYSPYKNLRLFAEAGLASLRQLRFTTREEKLADYSLPAVPYARLSLHLNFGKSPVGSQLFGNEF